MAPVIPTIEGSFGKPYELFRTHLDSLWLCFLDFDFRMRFQTGWFHGTFGMLNRWIVFLRNDMEDDRLISIPCEFQVMRQREDRVHR